MKMSNNKKKHTQILPCHRVAISLPLVAFQLVSRPGARQSKPMENYGEKQSQSQAVEAIMQLDN